MCACLVARVCVRSFVYSFACWFVTLFGRSCAFVFVVPCVVFVCVAVFLRLCACSCDCMFVCVSVRFRACLFV